LGCTTTADEPPVAVRRDDREIRFSAAERTVTVFPPGKIEPLHQGLRPNLLNDPYKNRKIDKYDKEPEFIYQFIKDRSTYIKEQISKFD